MGDRDLIGVDHTDGVGNQVGAERPVSRWS
jgi:hypothetical protein